MKEQLPLNIRLRDESTFDNFVGVAAAQLQSGAPFSIVCGGAGSGKSHLLQALCHAEPESIYLQSLDDHSPEVLHSLESFRLVCLDDVHLIRASREWEEALFHLINSLKDLDARLVMASPLPVNELNFKMPDLLSRLRSAMIIQTNELSDDEKVLLLQQRAQARGFELGQEVATFILGRAPRDMSSLIELLTRLELETLKQQRKVTIPFVKQAL